MIAVPSEVTSYLLSDLRPGTVYSVSVTFITKGQRVKSPPIHLVMPPLPPTLLPSADTERAVFLGDRYDLAATSGSVSTTAVTNGLANVRAEEIGIVVLVLIGMRLLQ